MKDEDPLKPLFDALQHDAEPIDEGRQEYTREAFRRERIMQPVEGAASPALKWKSAFRKHRGSYGYFDKDGNRVTIEAPDDDNNKLPEVPPQHRPEKRK